MSRPSPRDWGLTLPLAVALGALLLRITGLTYGLPDHIYHSDTPKQLERVAWFMRGHLVPSDTYPTLHMYAAALLLKAWLWLDPHAVDVGPTWTQVTTTVRLLNAGLGAGLVLLVYGLGRRLAGPGAGLLAAALLAVEPTHVLHAHYEMGDVLQAFCAVASVLAATAALAGGRSGAYVAAGVLAGLAASAKFYGVVAAGALAVAAAGRLRRDGMRRPLRQLALAALVTVATFVLTTPKLLLTPRDFLEGLRTSDELFTRSLPLLERPLVAGRLLAGLALDWPGPLLAGVGLLGLALVARASAAGRVVAATPAAVLLVYVLFRAGYLDDRNLVILIPFLAVGAAWTLDRLRRAGRGGAWGAGLLAAATLGTGLLASVHTAWLFRHDDTRQFAERWERTGLPPAATVRHQIEYPSPEVLRQIRTDYVALDSQNYQRFLDWHSLDRSPLIQATLAELADRGRLVKRFQLWPRAFTDATLLYYDLHGPDLPYAWPPPDDVARPADTLAFVDDRALPEHLGIRVTRAAQTLTVISPRPIDRLTVGVSGEGAVRVRHGFQTHTATLGAGQLALLRFSPWRSFPWFTAAYHVEVDARRGSVHARILTDGCQEAGPLLGRGRFAEATAALESCQGPRWTEPARLLDLAWARAESGQVAEARAALAGLEAAIPGLLAQLARLADQEVDDAWRERYRLALGQGRGFWAAHVFAAQAEAADARPGTVEAVPEARGGRLVRMRAPSDPESYLKLWLPQEFLVGPYLVTFRVRGASVRGGPLATFSVVRHLDNRPYDVLATRTWAGAAAGPGFEQVTLPVATDVEPVRLEARMLFHGRGTVELDEVTVTPDVRTALVARIRALRARGLLGAPGGP